MCILRIWITSRKYSLASLTLLFSIHCLLPLKYIAGADLGFFKGVAGTLGLQNQWSMFPKCYNVRTFFITTSVTKKLVITIRNFTIDCLPLLFLLQNGGWASQIKSKFDVKNPSQSFPT